MKKIEILGTGCPKCDKLAEMTEKTAKSLNIDYDLIKVKDVSKFASYGVMITPALVVDGELKIMGKVPSEEELKNMLQ